ncbi:DUF6114 domain-containing protein [Catellatospora sp. KI3]|uniref:DUF6114 domain-containing protein n=1 Tax=Catellatospora sp. KI3 TaxID=3041620 RepID=UPI002482D46D|nr:DUF6114 domain-containing protein [Catellatospora sp. KI3]MDI1462884.1 DUF6114 domain-containing protein [Catellatospora sp. KI3]
MSAPDTGMDSTGPDPVEPATADPSPAAAPRGFRHWRRTRPFWSGLLVTLGGLEITLTVLAPLPVMLRVGLQGTAGYLIPIVLTLCGLLIIFTPAQRIFNACVAMVLALASWLTSNLGGFLIGMLLALVGACLAFAWGPRRTPAAHRRR